MISLSNYFLIFRKTKTHKEKEKHIKKKKNREPYLVNVKDLNLWSVVFSKKMLNGM